MGVPRTLSTLLSFWKNKSFICQTSSYFFLLIFLSGQSSTFPLAWLIPLILLESKFLLNSPCSPMAPLGCPRIVCAFPLQPRLAMVWLVTGPFLPRDQELPGGRDWLANFCVTRAGAIIHHWSLRNGWAGHENNSSCYINIAPPLLSTHYVPGTGITHLILTLWGWYYYFYSRSTNKDTF